MGGKAGGEGWGSRRDLSRAPGTFFFSFFLFTILISIYVSTYDYIMKATTTITGPNDARRVVWALGEFFYFYIRVFH